MGSFHVFTSNRLERLSEALARMVQNPLSSPLNPEIILVQSKGMEHYVSLRLAELLGVCANVVFPFPNRFLDDLHERVTGSRTAQTPFDPKHLRWRIMRLLGEAVSEPAYAEIASYLRGDHKGLRRFQLAEKIADTFDQYSVFRPEMILSWEKGRHDGWQSALWNRLARDAPEAPHRTKKTRQLLNVLEGRRPVKGLPERVSVFGISALPRFHLEALAGLSRHADVYFYLMNPCREFWGDIVSPRSAAHEPEDPETRSEEADLHLESGNPLLASLGKIGRDFFNLLNEVPAVEHDLFEDVAGASLLERIQSDILNLRDRGKTGEKTPVRPGDRSIRIHSCHSPLREVEILRDCLLEVFEEDPGILPGDVLVTAPDIEEYTPLIKAIFDSPPSAEEAIPYSIADRTLIGESETVETFLRLLNLAGDRYAVSRVLAVLEAPPVMRRFSLHEEDRDRIRAWVVETGIRWGLDGSHRAAQGLPDFEENTWSSGVRRLLLGYAARGRGRRTFRGILPYDEIEGSDADLFEKFLDFATAIHETLPGLETPCLPGQWGRRLEQTLERFFLPDQGGELEFASLRKAFLEIASAEDPDVAGLNERLEPDVVRYLLKKRMEREGFGFGFMTGGVTFCAMLPMRSIPFKVICCLGMNGDAYPRAHHRPEFDLMARNPKPGDRSRRNDDRYIFLETILSARRRLHVSYVGQSNQDNTPLPPSVLVTELMEVVQQGFSLPHGEILDQLIIKHPLQAFSPAYFAAESPFFSYSLDHLESARALVNPKRPRPPFFTRGLADPGPEWNEPTLDALDAFFRNPSSFFLGKRLGIRLKDEEGLPEDRESFDLKGLNRYLMGGELLGRSLKDEDISESYPCLKAAGRLPHGTVGRFLCEDLIQEVEDFAQGVRSVACDPPWEAREMELEIDCFRLKGRLDGLHPRGAVIHRFAAIQPRDRLSAWIRHLFLNCLEGGFSAGRETFLLGLPQRKGTDSGWTVLRYRPVENPREVLEKLLRAYRSGLRRPLHFFPKTSCAFAEPVVSKNAPFAEALAQARKAWEGNDHIDGESADAAAALCFRDRDPLASGEFTSAALEIFAPLLRHEEKWKPTEASTS